MGELVDWRYFAYTWNESSSVREVAKKLGIKWITARRRAYDYRTQRKWQMMAGENVEHLPELKKFSPGRPRASLFK